MVSIKWKELCLLRICVAVICFCWGSLVWASSPATFIAQLNTVGIPDACVNKYSIIQQEKQALRFVYIVTKDVFENPRYIELLKYGDNDRIKTFVLEKEIYLRNMRHYLPYLASVEKGVNQCKWGDKFNHEVSRFRCLSLDLLQGNDMKEGVLKEGSDPDLAIEEFEAYRTATIGQPMTHYFQIDLDAVALEPLTPVLDLIPEESQNQPIYSTNLDYFGGNMCVSWRRIWADTDFRGIGGGYVGLEDNSGLYINRYNFYNRSSAGLYIVNCDSYRKVVKSLCERRFTNSKGGFFLDRLRGETLMNAFIKGSFDEESVVDKILEQWQRDREDELIQQGKPVIRAKQAEEKNSGLQTDNTVKIFTFPYKYNSRPNAVLLAHVLWAPASLYRAMKNLDKQAEDYDQKAKESIKALFYKGLLDYLNSSNQLNIDNILYEGKGCDYVISLNPRDEMELKDLSDGKIAYLHMDKMTKIWSPICPKSKSHGVPDQEVTELYNKMWKIERQFLENIMGGHESLALLYLKLSRGLKGADDTQWNAWATEEKNWLEAEKGIFWDEQNKMYMKREG